MPGAVDVGGGVMSEHETVGDYEREWCDLCGDQPPYDSPTCPAVRLDPDAPAPADLFDHLG